MVAPDARRNFEGEMHEEGDTRDLLPEGELLRRAIRWISEHRGEGTPWVRLVEEAGRRFDLSPRDEDFLLRNFRGDER